MSTQHHKRSTKKILMLAGILVMAVIIIILLFQLIDVVGRVIEVNRENKVWTEELLLREQQIAISKEKAELDKNADYLYLRKISGLKLEDPNVWIKKYSD